MEAMTYAAIYLAALSLAAVIITIHDKSAARRRKWRVRESALLLAAAMGGSFAMLITMLLIRHKTKHAKFMAGLPVIIAVQIAVIVLITARGWLWR